MRTRAQVLVLALPLAALFLPLGVLLLSSFIRLDPSGRILGWGLHHYIDADFPSVGVDTLSTTALFAVGSAVLACLFGTVAAWLHERTDMPLRRLLGALVLAPLFVPGTLYAYAWILLASPRNGLLNQVATIWSGGTGPFGVYGYTGMIWVEALRAAPMVFLLVAAMLRTLDPSRELAAQVAGASLPTVFRRISLPLIAPALGAAFLLALIRAVGAFEIPAMLGAPAGLEVFAFRIYRAFRNFPGDIGPAAAESVPLLVLALMLVALHEGWIKHRAGNPASAFRGAGGPRLTLGRARWSLAMVTVLSACVAAVLPLLAIAWSSVSPFFMSPGVDALARLHLDAYRAVLASDVVSTAAWQTLRLCALCATLIIAGSVALSWVVERTGWRGRQSIEPAVDTLFAVPGAVLGVAILVTHTLIDTGLFGSAALLVLAFFTRHLPQGFRFARAGLAQIPRELEFAASVAGASGVQGFLRITLPLMLPGLLAGWLYVAMVCARDLSTALLLYLPGQQPVAIVLWEFWQNGQLMELSALSVLFIALMLLLGALTGTLARQRRRESWRC